MWTIMLSKNRTILFLPISFLCLLFLFSCLTEVTRASMLFRIILVGVNILAWFLILGEKHPSVLIVKYGVNWGRLVCFCLFWFCLFVCFFWRCYFIKLRKFPAISDWWRVYTINNCWILLHVPLMNIGFSQMLS